MGADAARPLFVEHDRFAFDPRQAADPRADRTARAEAFLLGHVEQPGILDRLPRGIDAVDDERIDLALDLVIDALAGVETISVVGGLHLACDPRSEERRVGKECVSTCKSRGLPYPSKKKTTKDR